MKIAVICFTVQGAKTSLKIRDFFEQGSEWVEVWCRKKEYQPPKGICSWLGSLKEWTKKAFEDSDAVIFVGAAGIAVRSIAPYLQSKTTDPAVLVVDELGKFVISLVSGHMGGANELCSDLAGGLGAIPVITTATDLNERFAVDVFAKKNRLFIPDMKLAKMISARLLDGEKVGFGSEFPWNGKLPEGLDPGMQKQQGGEQSDLAAMERENPKQSEEEQGSPEGQCPEYGFCIALNREKRPFLHTLHLLPRIAVLGVGCRKGISSEALEEFLLRFLEEHHIAPEVLKAVCSIDRKKEEAAILTFCGKYQLPFMVYSARELSEVPGSFSGSAFVADQIGVDNVCERSAVKGSGNGKLLLRKKAESGMTAALAIEEWRAYFE